MTLLAAEPEDQGLQIRRTASHWKRTEYDEAALKGAALSTSGGVGGRRLRFAGDADGAGLYSAAPMDGTAVVANGNDAGFNSRAGADHEVREVRRGAESGTARLAWQRIDCRETVVFAPTHDLESAGNAPATNDALPRLSSRRSSHPSHPCADAAPRFGVV